MKRFKGKNLTFVVLLWALGISHFHYLNFVPKGYEISSSVILIVDHFAPVTQDKEMNLFINPSPPAGELSVSLHCFCAMFPGSSFVFILLI